MPTKHLQLTIHGRVQGVFFRASTKDKAEKLGLTGFVKNRPDGTAYIEAEGEKEALEKFINWVHHGPPAAHVTNVEIREKEILQGYETFEVH